MDYTDTLDKALAHLRELEMDKALNLFYKLLSQYPKDLDLIKRIYAIECKRPRPTGLEKICRHLFSLQTSRKELHEFIVNAYADFRKKLGKTPVFSKQESINLLRHLAHSRHLNDAEEFASVIKTQMASEPETPAELFYYCEALIARKQMIKAREELKYLITYYGESHQAKNAVSLLDWVKIQIN
jgi:predicted Zn-dependent protease